MTLSWSQWYNGLEKSEVEFVIDLIKFLEDKQSKVAITEFDKKRRFRIQIDAPKYKYGL